MKGLDRMADLHLFKLIETSNEALVTSRVPGQYIVQDDGQMYYDNTLGARVKLSPDLSGLLTKSFASAVNNETVAGIKYSQNTVDTNATDIVVTYINPTNSTTREETFTVKLSNGKVLFNSENGEILIDIDATDSVEVDNDAPITSNAVALLKSELITMINESKELGVPTIKTFSLTGTATADSVLATWQTETGKPAKAGDIAILTKNIGETLKVEYTAYVFDGNTWQAMDGNYDASNVYLGTDILLAGNYKTVGNIDKTSTSATKNAGWVGKSIADILTNIFTQTLNPSKPTPSVSVALDNAGAKEVGTTITPSFTVTFDPKTYSYGSARDNGKAGGSTYAEPGVATVTLSEGGPLSGEMVEGDNWNGGKVTLTLTATPIKVTSATSFNATKVTCVYDDGEIPYTNTKQEYASSQVIGNTASSTTATSKITGYYAKLWGYTTADNLIADPANLTADDIATLTKVQSVPTSTTNSAMRQIFFIVPKDSVSKVDVIASTTIPFGTAAKGTAVSITDASGVDTYECDVWYISQPLPGADNETYSISLS